MTAHQVETRVPGLNMLKHDAWVDAGAGCGIGIVGLTGRHREACARALGLDADAATALLHGLQARNTKPDVGGNGQPGPASLLPEPEVTTKPTQMRLPATPSMTHAVEEAASLPTLLAQHPGLQILGFYLSPWEAFLEACEESGVQNAEDVEAWMQVWAECHQKQLAARQLAPDRVFLINAGRMEHPEGLRSLLQAMGARLSERPLADVSIPRLPINAGLSRLLASQMAETGREYWEIYEALESCAVLFEREPEFQATADLVDASDLTSLLISFSQAQTLAADAVHTSSGRETPGHHRASLRDTMQILDEVQRENELLSMQLHQLYEELHYYVAYNAGLREILNDAGDTAETARRMISELAPRPMAGRD